MMRLESYAKGEWVAGGGRPTTLFDAINGEPVAEISSDGVDFAGMAESMGVAGYKVEQPADLAETLKKAVDSDKPALVEVYVDPRA